MATHAAPIPNPPAIEPAALRYPQPVGERPGPRSLRDLDLADAARAPNLQGIPVPERLGTGRPSERLGQDNGQGNRKVTAAHTSASLQAGPDGAGASSSRVLRPRHYFRSR